MGHLVANEVFPLLIMGKFRESGGFFSVLYRVAFSFRDFKGACYFSGSF